MKKIDATEKDIRNFDWENQRDKEDEKLLNEEYLASKKDRLKTAKKVI